MQTKKLREWNGMDGIESLNVAKTHSMLISTKQKHSILKGQNEDLKLKIHDNEFEVVNKTK